MAFILAVWYDGAYTIMASREQRARIAAETVAIFEAGAYTAPSGRTVSVREPLQSSLDRSFLVTPDEVPSLRERAGRKLADRSFQTAFSVRNETTFAAARRLVAQVGPDRVAALNFASAKKPGGGFLSGAQAQEECLARASGLYPTLERHKTYYEVNRRASLLYTDHLIVSPRVPVFRDDEDRLLEESWEVTILTSPAPNAGAIAQNEPASVDRIVPAFRQRIEQVLAAAVVCDQTALVLGAWGCGVFANSPTQVARLFAEHLLGGGAFAHAFEDVAFAVLDPQGGNLAAFVEMFGEAAG